MSLKELPNEACFLKAGFFGFEASGKTTSAVLTAIGLHKYIKSEKPIAFWDSETGSDFTKHYFDYAGIKLLREKSRSLKSLSDTIKEAQKLCDILIIDSLTHPYKELTKAYRRKKKKGGWFISIQDWQPIKETWSNHFADPFVNSSLHIIWCARAKNLFDEVTEQGFNGEEFNKTVQTGVGVRSETESSFEPSLQVEFKRIYDKDNVSAKYFRQATIVKDRFGIIDGKEMNFITFHTKENDLDYKKIIDENPTFNFFLPHIQRLNLGGEHIGFNEDTSEELFNGSDKDYVERMKRIKIALENIENGLVAVFPSRSDKDKAFKIAILYELFKTRSWKEVESQDLFDLEDGVIIIDRLKKEILEGLQIQDENELHNKISEIKEILILEHEINDNDNEKNKDLELFVNSNSNKKEIEKTEV